MSEPRGAHGGRNEIIEELGRVQADFHQLAGYDTRRAAPPIQRHPLVESTVAVPHGVRLRRRPNTATPGPRPRPSRTQRQVRCHPQRRPPPVPPDQLPRLLRSGQLLTTRAQAALLDRTIDALQRKLAAETDASLALSAFRTAWTPTPAVMSVLDVYHFATQHYDHHRRQLDL